MERLLISIVIERFRPLYKKISFLEGVLNLSLTVFSGRLLPTLV